jgi:hypothetical protein
MARPSVFSGAVWSVVLTSSDWLRIAMGQNPVQNYLLG